MVTADAVVGIEIKSDADTYARLERQVADYNRFFDYNYVVAGSRHGLHIEEHVPDWWGIITVEQREETPDFYVLRKGRENPEVDWGRKMSLLWRPELVHIQQLNGLPAYREKSKVFVIRKILERVPREILRKQISEELFERDYTAIGEAIEEYRREKGKTGRRGQRAGRRARR